MRILMNEPQGTEAQPGMANQTNDPQSHRDHRAQNGCLGKAAVRHLTHPLCRLKQHAIFCASRALWWRFRVLCVLCVLWLLFVLVEPEGLRIRLTCSEAVSGHSDLHRGRVQQLVDDGGSIVRGRPVRRQGAQARRACRSRPCGSRRPASGSTSRGPRPASAASRELHLLDVGLGGGLLRAPQFVFGLESSRQRNVP